MVAERRFPTGVPDRTTRAVISPPARARCPEVNLILPRSSERGPSAAGRQALLHLHRRPRLHHWR
eukprot:12035774-Alexandrium_andersonii.AAC.1